MRLVRSQLLLYPCLFPLLTGNVPAVHAQNDGPKPNAGELQIIDADGKALGSCPLEHTDVQATISGFLTRVTVKQTFRNPLDRKIEAIYVFPLSADAAVDEMVMLVGERRIVGQIKERAEARQIYEQAKAAGHVASLLDQERPNIFTQSVANIEPGVTVEIEISYTETLQYEDGVFEWAFPMVVGPRYIPGGGSAPAPMTPGRDTPQVPDGSRISPPVAPKGKRAGHDISLTVRLNTGGLGLKNVTSVLHEIDPIESDKVGTAVVRLTNQKEIPNKDFILRYGVESDGIGNAFLVHEDERGRFFTLILQPPERVVPDNLMPRELIFVLDTSGSMSGFPIEQAKQVMARLIDTMRPEDTFNLITFAGNTRILWSDPRPNTQANRREAQQFLLQQRGGGGTEMMKAINAALVQTVGRQDRPLTPVELANLPADGRRVSVRVEWMGHVPDDARPDRVYIAAGEGRSISATRFSPSGPRGGFCPVGEPILLTGTWNTVAGERLLTVESARYARLGPAGPIRIVCFMTDGYVGNDMAIIDAVKNNADTTRVFSFGIGNSVNRFLLEGMAHAGRGEVEFVTLHSEAAAAVERFHERVLAPVLTDVELDWGDLPVADVYPRRVPDLFSSKPILVHGRLNGPASGTITIRGNTGAGRFERAVSLSGTAATAHNEALASLWARAKVTDLMNRDLRAMQSGSFPDELKRQITALGIEFRLMTQFTSFVAVEELTVTAGGEAITIQVPVEMPDGVSHEGVFGAAGRGVGLAHVFMSAMGYAGGSGARTAGAPLAPPTLPAAKRGLMSGLRALDREEADEWSAADVRHDRKRRPADKLADVLRGLAQKVERDGAAGNLTIDALKVIDWRVDLIITLSDLSDETRKALAALGFQQTNESKTVKLLIGTLDVRKLDELTKLDVVLAVRPVR